jgi:O-antigen ligase
MKKSPAKGSSRILPVRDKEASTSFDRVGRICLGLLIVVVPLVLFPSAKESFRVPKLMVADWLGLASLLGFAAGLWRQGRWRDAWKSSALRALVPLLVVAGLGGFVTAHIAHFREAIIDLAIGCACLAGWSLALASDQLARFLRLLLWPASILALIGILQAHGFRPFLFTGIEDPRLAITSLAGNPGDLAAFLVLPCLIAQWVLRARRGQRWLWPALSLVLCAYATARTQTLVAIVAILLGSALFWGLCVPRRLALRGLIGGLLIAVVGVLLVAPLRTRVIDKVMDARSGNWNAMLTGRLDGWRTALHMLETHPVAGVGQGGFRPEFLPAKLALQKKGVEFFVGQQQGVFANAHNDVLELGAEIGLPGLLAFGWALFLLIQSLRRRRMATATDSETDNSDVALAWSMVAALAIVSVGQFPFHVALTAFPAVLALAWIFRRGDEVASGPAEAPAPQPKRDMRETEGPAPDRWSLALPLLTLLSVALVAQTGRLLHRREASVILRQVEFVSAGIERGTYPQAYVGGNLQLLRRAALLDPSDVGVPIAAGAQYLLLPNPEAAETIAACDVADRLEPRPATLMLRGRALLTEGRREEARAQLDQAVRLDPTMMKAFPDLRAPALPAVWRP